MSDKKLVGSCLIGQSGGPTAVINASAYGLIEAALQNEAITKVYAAHYGISGVLNDQLMIMDEEDPENLRLMLQTPAAVLGSCRYKMTEPEENDKDYRRLLEIFQKYDIRYFFYNGGNDSMDTCNKISKYMQKVGYACRIMGVPKTIDNDLWGTDHCPGYGSAAKFVATSCMEIYHDARVYDTGMICIIEIMGRHAGWLTAASSLATAMGCGPDLIYLPERVFDMDAFKADVKRVFEKSGKCIVAVSEGVHDASGKLIAEYGADNAPVDAFGHKQLGGLAATLAHILQDTVNTKIRPIELSLLQRCAAHCASATDVQEAFQAGKAAVECAVSGITDKMVGFARETDDQGNYRCAIKLMDLTDVANTEKKVPDAWINAEGNGLLPAFQDYALPLIQGEPERTLENGLPRFAHLKKIRA